MAYDQYSMLTFVRQYSGGIEVFQLMPMASINGGVLAAAYVGLRWRSIIDIIPAWLMALSIFHIV